MLCGNVAGLQADACNCGRNSFPTSEPARHRHCAEAKAKRSSPSNARCRSAIGACVTKVVKRTGSSQRCARRHYSKSDEISFCCLVNIAIFKITLPGKLVIKAEHSGKTWLL